MDSRRAESFSDGVFAVAITVLVFNLLPIGSNASVLTGHGLLQTLLHSWPAYLAYVVSFLTIGIMWLNHHGMLAQVTRVDRPLLVLNLFLLMGIVALPFPTALVADHLVGAHSADGQDKVATFTYGIVMIAISVIFGLTWLYLNSHREALGGRPFRPRKYSTLRFTSGNVGYVAATLIALASPITALIIYGLLGVYYLFDHLPYPAADPGEEPAPEADG